jgi:hypothetical protein
LTGHDGSKVPSKEDVMSTDVQAPTGQIPPPGRDEAPTTTGMRQEPQTLIQESIKYRRRAQDAERRAAALEAEIQALRQAQDERAASLETKLAEAAAEADTLRRRFDSLERDRQLERELLRAGCADTETALALAHQRLASGDAPSDLAAFAKGLLEEKPHLRGKASTPPAAAGRALPPPTAAVKPAAANEPRRAAARLAEQARESGSAGDLLAYMRARRGQGA